MILNRDYDKALWLIIMSDEQRRDEIVSFIDGIMLVLGDKIKESITKYNENNDNLKQVSYSYLRGEMKASDGILYWYHLSALDGSLYLGRQVNMDGIYIGNFYLCLERNVIDKTMALKNLVSTDIGNIEFGFAEELVDRGSKDYKMIDTLIGTILMTTTYCDGTRKTRYRRVNLNEIPKDYNAEDLRSKGTLNRLVRKRKKGFISVKRDSE